MTKELKVKPQRKKKIASLEKRKARGGWIFVLPFIIGFVLIYLPIIFDSVYYTFTTSTITPGTGEKVFTWVGFANYQEVLTGTEFVETLITGLENMIFEIPMILIFSLFMAVLLNQKMAGRAIFRAIFFVPVILSTGIMASIDAASLQNDTMGSMEGMEDGTNQEEAGGIVDAMDVQNLFQGMAVGGGLLDYVTEAINNIYDIVNRSGVQMLIFLSGLQSISPAIYESVQIDGASAWETFWKITFPMISPMILVNAVYTIIDSFTAESNVIMSYISDAYTEEGQVLSTAMSWIYFVVVLAIVGLVALALSSFVFYQRRD